MCLVQSIPTPGMILEVLFGRMGSCSSPQSLEVEEQSKDNESHPWHKLHVFGIGQDLENLSSDS